MRMIEKYIQFAIDNWYKFWHSKDFILKWIDFYDFKTQESYNKKSEHWAIYSKMLKYELELSSFFTTCYYPLNDLITSKEFIEAIARWYKKKDTALSFVEDEITIQQAFAIRDNKLENFITNILWTKQ